MADISQVKLPTGNVYNFKDEYARTQIEDIKSSATGAMHYRGRTTTALEDGSETNPITIDNKNYTAVAGDVVTYLKDGKELEFAFTGTKWSEYGSTGSLKAFAFAEAGTASYKPAGTVSQPTFSGTATTITTEVTAAGGVSQPTFTGDAASIEVSIKPKGSVTNTIVADNSGNYTPAGTVTQPTFTGTEATITVSGKSEGSVTVTATESTTGNYQPKGTVSKPNVTVTPSTTNVKSITGVGKLASCTLPTYSVANEILTITGGSFTQGELPSASDNISVMTGATAELASTPTFTGTKANISGTFEGTTASYSATYTPTGTVSKPTFNGTKVAISSSFSGTSETVTADYTPTGTVSKPTFTGTKVSGTASYTPQGTVTQPTFTGNNATIEVTPRTI